MPMGLLQDPNQQENVEAYGDQHVQGDQVANGPDGGEWAWDVQ